MEIRSGDTQLLEKGMCVTVQTVDKRLRTGIVTEFGEHVVILSCGVHRYVARKKDLEVQGYRIPLNRKNRSFSIVN